MREKEFQRKCMEQQRCVDGKGKCCTSGDIKMINETMEIVSACKCVGKCLCEGGSPPGIVRMRPGEELIDRRCNVEYIQNLERDLKKKTVVISTEMFGTEAWDVRLREKTRLRVWITVYRTNLDRGRNE